VTQFSITISYCRIMCIYIAWPEIGSRIEKRCSFRIDRSFSVILSMMYPLSIYRDLYIFEIYRIIKLFRANNTWIFIRNISNAADKFILRWIPRAKYFVSKQSWRELEEKQYYCLSKTRYMTNDIWQQFINIEAPDSDSKFWIKILLKCACRISILISIDTTAL